MRKDDEFMEIQQSGVAGTVVSLWRYPVKSMLGEEIDLSSVTERGLRGDRAYALIDQTTGKVASAKRPQRWGKLFAFHAAFAAPIEERGALPPVRITCPDGTTATTDADGLSQMLSDALGQDVALVSSAPSRAQLDEYWPPLEGIAPSGELVANPEGDTITVQPVSAAAPPGTFFDLAAVHLLTTSTLDTLREQYPAGRFEVRRFRPNLLVTPAPGAQGFVENDWIGRTLVIGHEVRLKVSLPCPRCVMTTLPQADLPQDMGILKAILEHNRVPVGHAGAMGCAGVYANVVQGGVIRRGDRLRIE